MDENKTMKKKTNFLFLAFLLGFVFISTIKVDQAVDIADDILELAIRQNLNYYGKPIYKSQLLNIYDLDISGKGINQLDGIEHFRNLEVLDLSQNSVRDMTPVESLTNLKIINLKRNEICDLENVNFHAISGLELIELNLGYNNLDNVSLLGDMDSLNRLDLAGNRINDLEPISSLILLNELDLTGNNIDTISGLTLYASLEKLVLRDNNLEKIVELGYFENLKYLNLRENHIKDLSPVGNLQTLQYLNIHSNTMIESIAPLKNLVQLKQLIMRNVPIGEQISYINGLNNLNRLNLRNTKTEDFSVLINLMESGVLQDREDVGLFAEVNLLDNDLGLDYLYQYHNMRPYWSNISYRWPFSLPIYHRLIESPGFSHESGYYTDDFLLTFSSANPDHEIIYTIDGSEPIIDRKGRPLGTTRIYYGPIEILNQKTQPNILSEIKSSPLNAGDYSPPNEIFKAPIIRAQSIDKNGNASNIVSHTYFVDEIMMNRYTLPVVSLITDPEGFFGDKAGIYVPGEIIQAYDNIHCCSANYRQRGIKWERLVVLQLFNPDGEVELSQNIGVRIHGGASRDYPKKSLRIYSGYYYDPKGLINYNFFPMLDDRLSDQSVNTFDSLILRTGGNDDEQLSMIRDIIAHRLLENTLLDIQGNYPVVLFLNGEYWGIYSFRTRYDDHYFLSYYGGIDPDNLIVLEGVGSDYQILKGDPDDAESYEAILRLATTNLNVNNRTVSPNETYDQISSLMDIDNYLDYYISQLYFNKRDFLATNVRFWRTRSTQSVNNKEKYGFDGKWRWMVIDVDFGFRNPNENLFYDLTRPEGIHYFNQPRQTVLFRSLLSNQKFSNNFIVRYSDHLNTTFREDVVIDMVEKYKKIYSPEMDEQIHRWGNAGGSYADWEKEIDTLKEFALLRPTYQREHIIDYFGLSGTALVTTNVNSLEGFITINTIDIIDSTAGVADPGYWTGIYFQDVPITITAFSYPDYEFSHWEGVDLDDSTQDVIELTLSNDIEISAIFAPKK